MTRPPGHSWVRVLRQCRACHCLRHGLATNPPIVRLYTAPAFCNTTRTNGIVGFGVLTARRLRHITAAPLWRPASDRGRAAMVSKEVRSV
jgi:hypothetical protein